MLLHIVLALSTIDLIVFSIMSVEKVLDFLNLSGKGGGGSGKVVASPLQKSLLYAAKNGDTDSLRELVNRRITVQSKKKSILSDSYPENITPLVRDIFSSSITITYLCLKLPFHRSLTHSPTYPHSDL